MGSGCVSEIATTGPVARSPIEPPPPVVVIDGWEVSGRRARGGLTVTDCTPLAKVGVRAPVGGRAAAELAVPFGRAARDPDGTLVTGAGPGEWLLLAAPGRGPALTGRAEDLAARFPDELITATDLTHGRALMRLTGPGAAEVLAKVCGIDTGDGIAPDGAAFRTSVAALATDIIRDDNGGERSYLLHCERSSGAYLFGELLAAGGEFGIEIDGFTTPGI
jgi:sarcosine oxidase, subunit gamma